MACEGCGGTRCLHGNITKDPNRDGVICLDCFLTWTHSEFESFNKANDEQEKRRVMYEQGGKIVKKEML